MGFLTDNVTDERDGLAVFASQQVHQYATTLQDLTPEQLRATPTASGMCLGGLALHILAVVTRFTGVVLAAPEAPTSTEHPEHDSMAVAEGRPDALLETDTAQTLIDVLEKAATELAAALRSTDPDTPVPAPEEPWIPQDAAWTVRWVALHMVEEVARHTGHADILRESIDGRGAYELNARADGEAWPPAWE